jgi:hypothetical protein
MKDTLTELLTEGGKIAAELARLDKMEAAARAALVAVTDEDIQTPSAQQKISDARLALDLVAARRAKIRAPHGEVWKVLREQFGAQAKAWDTRVSEGKRKEVEDFIKANLPFYEGDERACRRALEGETFERLPCAHKWRRGFFYMPFYPDPRQEDLIRDVKIFLRHIERQSKALGWA